MGCPFGSITSVSFWCPMQGVFRGVLPGADAIALHEIHLARQSSLQVPVGHISVPGGIKLCSPGTFLVANYLIIKGGGGRVSLDGVAARGLVEGTEKAPEHSIIIQ